MPDLSDLLASPADKRFLIHQLIGAEAGFPDKMLVYRRNFVRLSMTTNTAITVLYREFTDALTEVLAENAVGPARRGRVARARGAVKKHAEYNEHAYFLAVETAFENWEAMQNAVR
jgi:hypothetical protein